MIRKTFDEIVSFARTGLNPRKNFQLGNGSNKYITIKNIHNNTLVVDENTDVVDDDAIKLIHKRSQIKKGDILFCSIGRMGDMYIIEDDPVGWDINESVFAFTLDTSIIRQKFFYYVFKNQSTLDYLSKNSSGSTFKSIKMNQLKKMVFDLPSLEEQDSIVGTLDTVSSIIEARNGELKALDDLIKARFVEMFGDTEINSNRYTEIKLGDICDLQNGYAFKSGDYVDSSDVNNCRMSNIRPDGGFDSDYSPKYLPDKFWDTYKAYRLYDGDVIIAMTDMASDPKILGVPTIVNSKGKKFLLNQRVGKLVFSDDEQFNRVFLMRFLSQSYIRKNLAKKAGGSTQINVGKPAILDITIVKPQIEEQNQFAEFVAQVDKSKVVKMNLAYRYQ